jgi:hypothetical protein
LEVRLKSSAQEVGFARLLLIDLDSWNTSKKVVMAREARRTFFDN